MSQILYFHLYIIDIVVYTLATSSPVLFIPLGLLRTIASPWDNSLYLYLKRKLIFNK